MSNDDSKNEPNWKEAEASLLSAFDSAITQTAAAPPLAEDEPFGDEEDHGDDVFESADVRGQAKKRISELRAAKEFEQEETTMVVDLDSAEEYSKPIEASPSLIRKRNDAEEKMVRKEQERAKQQSQRLGKAPPAPKRPQKRSTNDWLNAASDGAIPAYTPATPPRQRIKGAQPPPPPINTDVERNPISFITEPPENDAVFEDGPRAQEVTVSSLPPKAPTPPAAIPHSVPVKSAPVQAQVSVDIHHRPKPKLTEIPNPNRVDELGPAGADDTFSRPRIQRDFDLPRATTQTNIQVPVEFRQPARPVFKADANVSPHLDFDAPEMSEPVVPSWSERSPLTGAIDRRLTTAAWQAERLPFGQETVVPVVENEDVFDIERELAKSKSGTVYVARIPESPDPVALKVLSKALSVELRARQRFRREIRSHAALSHPNIVQVFRYGRRRGRYFMATELMLGTLEEIISRTGALPTAICAIVLEDILKGIQYAHLRQVLHRELKPSNILVSNRGEFKIGDFSVAKSALDPNQSQSNAMFGTPAYMSPEQATGRTLGPRSDLFAISSLGFLMCTGIEAYRRDNVHLTLEAVKAAATPTPLAITPSVHPVIAKIIAKMGHRDPRQRYKSAYEALRDLWPLSRLVQKRYPKVRKQFAKNPERIAKQLFSDECTLEMQHAKRVMNLGEDHMLRSALATYRAYALAPHDLDAERALGVFETEYGMNFSRDISGLIEANYNTAPESDPQVLEERAGREGRIWDSYRFLALSAEAKPSDDFAKTKLNELGHRSTTSPFDRGKFKEEDEHAIPEVGSTEARVARGSSVSFKLKAMG